jgi:phosphoribosylglycinamide formyltransferase-1
MKIYHYNQKIKVTFSTKLTYIIVLQHFKILTIYFLLCIFRRNSSYNSLLNLILQKNSQMNVAIFASGNGSNAQKIIEHFSGNSHIKIALILSNKKDAFVIQRAKKMNIPSLSFTTAEFRNTAAIQEKLKEYNIGFIVLAGFMIMIPDSLIDMYPGRIVNIHPALLPKYGGKGMFGENVHCAVIAAKEKESGITIHYVNESYDEGKIIFQARCEVKEDDTPETLAAKIHELEHRFYPEVIERVITEEI